MLAILTSHPIQYQVPIWRALAASGKVPFEVWYLTHHGVFTSADAEFGKSFAWDMDLLDGYPHRRLEVNRDCDMGHFHGVRLREELTRRLRSQGVKAMWIEGWRFSALWKAVKAAKRAGVEVWMRGESNDLRRDALWKRLAKQVLLARHLTRVDRFLCIGSANRRLYGSYGFGKSRMVWAPYCVDNDRFAQQAALLRPKHDELRAKWGIPQDAFCFLFCGKFITKKRPLDVVKAARMLLENRDPASRPLHLLFVGAGELGGQMRRACRVAFDAEEPVVRPFAMETAVGEQPLVPTASFASFLNQSQIAAAYVAADALVLPSSSGETWGLVVNEAMACGTPTIASDQCGCAEDLPARVEPRLVFRYGDMDSLARAMQLVIEGPIAADRVLATVDSHHLRHTIAAIESLYRNVTGCSSGSAYPLERRCN